MERTTQLSAEVGALLAQHGHVMTTAESCTGGGVAAAITDIAGSSGWLDRAFVTYSNEAKMEMLGVHAQTLEENGAVSEPVVIEMVQGALGHSNATIGVSISGIAGPGGGSKEKPVGTVCFAFADKQDWLLVETMHFDGDRVKVREQAVFHALTRIHQHLAEKN
ncbi:Nicotinamide-nucleotide amidohydrolase PncC [Vibrio sp. B1FLJ16]|uniref:nicotinamide-nucleotide amidase n=1 Tax=Vibrio sp. B1FLJ16 TaxID=2751178 RepID=UPI0015F706AE|nr:nicotinamide-nucleotide amidase [Vibrio sp. B1FLJ16]CAD7811023.1 Nicotinamide-nucleotide amidohydrolase PncC [Vibrio sp. B1FLJ16]CAE6913855.1 Nicotinamide-nucleotide amidohydrolase PncC [Vibrio sp. B1FLJ16]